MRPYLVSPVTLAPRSPRPSRWWPVLFAVLVGALGMLLALPALAQGSPVVPFEPPSAEEFLARGSLAALLVMLGVRFTRALAPVPADGSLAAKRITAGLCVAYGLLLGWWGVAPAVAAGLAGKLLGGFGAGGLAYFGAGVLGSKLRREGQP